MTVLHCLDPKPIIYTIVTPAYEERWLTDCDAKLDYQMQLQRNHYTEYLVVTWGSLPLTTPPLSPSSPCLMLAISAELPPPVETALGCCLRRRLLWSARRLRQLLLPSSNSPSKWNLVTETKKIRWMWVFVKDPRIIELKFMILPVGAYTCCIVDKSVGCDQQL